MGTMLAFVLEAAPTVGDVFRFDGQDFKVAKVEPYVRRDGEKSIVVTWHSSCPECATTVINTSGFAARFPRRRCPAHLSPRRKVNS